MSASTRVLLTAFERYDHWTSNSSWLALQEMTRCMPETPKITTRLYPVDFQAARERLKGDLAKNYDIVLHLGQLPGLGRIQLEAIAINVGGHSHQLPGDFGLLDPDGPVAHRSRLPLAEWAARIRAAGIPAQVSYHAGTYLCNAIMYLAHRQIEFQKLTTRVTFIHFPLACSQTADVGHDVASMPVELAASALQILMQEIANDPA